METRWRRLLAKCLDGFAQNVCNSAQRDDRFTGVCQYSPHMTDRPNNHALISEKGEQCPDRHAIGEHPFRANNKDEPYLP